MPRRNANPRWTKDASSHMLNELGGLVDQREFSLPYTSVEVIFGADVGAFTPQQCQKRFKDLLKKVRQFRTFGEVIEDMRLLVVNDIKGLNREARRPRRRVRGARPRVIQPAVAVQAAAIQPVAAPAAVMLQAVNPPVDQVDDADLDVPPPIDQDEYYVDNLDLGAEEEVGGEIEQPVVPIPVVPLGDVPLDVVPPVDDVVPPVDDVVPPVDDVVPPVDNRDVENSNIADAQQGANDDAFDHGYFVTEQLQTRPRRTPPSPRPGTSGESIKPKLKPSRLPRGGKASSTPRPPDSMQRMMTRKRSRESSSSEEDVNKKRKK